jgi:hypothetical protein
MSDTDGMARLTMQSPVVAYGELLTEMHRLINIGKGDSSDAEALADRMEAPWHAMNATEQKQMRDLAAELNALRETNNK